MFTRVHIGPLKRAAALVAALLAVGLIGPAAATAAELDVVSSRELAPRLTEHTLRTPALASETKVRVLVPDSYRTQPQRRYPVLFLLHGGNGDHSDWTNPELGQAERLTAGLPVIVVMPDAGHGGWFTDWYNNGAGGQPQWERYHVGQLLPWIDGRYRTFGDRRRALLGLSMGGFGAMSYAARNPDQFVAAASFSGAVDTNTPPGAGPAVIDALALQDGGGPGSLWGQRGSEEVRWRGHNPWDLADNLRGLQLTLRSGNGQQGGPYGGGGPLDPFEGLVYQESVSFHRRLDALGIAHVWDDYGPGGHSWPYWRRGVERTLPDLMRVLVRPPAPPAQVTHTAIEPSYAVYGWRVGFERPALEFSRLERATACGFGLSGSGSANVVTPPRYRPRGAYPVTVTSAAGERRGVERADADGRLHLRLALGPATTGQQYRPGTDTRSYTARVAIAVPCTASAPPARSCLARRSPVGRRGVGRARLGVGRSRLLGLPGAGRRGRRGVRLCVKGGRGAVAAGLSARGRVALVATTAPGHGNRGVRPGVRAGRLVRAYPRRRRVGRGLYRASRRSRMVIGVRRGRVWFVAVAGRRLIANRRALARELRHAGVAPKRRGPER